MSESFMPFIWVAVALLVLIVMQRWIHAHLHGLSLLITGRPQWAVALYAIILFPGVLLHEVSHWLMATVLGVRTGSMSLVPRLKPDGSVQLGYVEYYKGKTLGPIRESLIGGAPLLAGTAVILLIGFRVFSVTSLAAAVQTGSIDSLTLALGDIFATNDILVWLYLLFAISNAMLPSPSDRRAWPAFLLIMAVLTAVLFLIGLDDEIMAGLAGPAATVFGYLGTGMSMAIGINILFMLLIAALEALISRIRGVHVIYGSSQPPEGSKNMVV
ncbi:MAG: hypothetical protein KDE56_11605 [Anaerolineales bacterium]|nr:hypothetical protein [Anaerolineales bacterium]